MNSPIFTRYTDGIEYSYKNKRVFVSNMKKNEHDDKEYYVIFTKRFEKMSDKEIEEIDDLPTCEFGNPDDIPSAIWRKPKSEYCIFYSFHVMSKETIMTMAFHTMAEPLDLENLNKVRGIFIELVKT